MIRAPLDSFASGGPDNMRCPWLSTTIVLKEFLRGPRPMHQRESHSLRHQRDRWEQRCDDLSFPQITLCDRPVWCFDEEALK